MFHPFHPFNPWVGKMSKGRVLANPARRYLQTPDMSKIDYIILLNMLSWQCWCTPKDCSWSWCVIEEQHHYFLVVKILMLMVKLSLSHEFRKIFVWWPNVEHSFSKSWHQEYINSNVTQYRNKVCAKHGRVSASLYI